MKLCYILGYPIEHTMSPEMHNAAFNALGLDMEYRLASVKPEDLGAYVENELRKNNVLGCSVTIPHKVEVMKYIDEIDETAAEIGAVNTIVNRDGVLKGYNTDATGGIQALEEEYGDLKEANVLLLGAGGAARALAYVLGQKAKTVTILNRSENKAVSLATHLKSKSKAEINHGSLSELENYVKDVDIILNTTPLGMSPKIDGTPIPNRLLHQDLMVYDIVYNPIQTRLLREAEAVGARTLSGVRMLVYQGVVAFRLWTGMDPPVELMLEKVETRLRRGHR
ncbi:MAG: shikimate dehydrogenase [Candidatus Bathyarchaeota archaeon]|nr:shikimate dehydrogenase [Candidatus Bathyarchaeota archaeon]